MYVKKKFCYIKPHAKVYTPQVQYSLVLNSRDDNMAKYHNHKKHNNHTNIKTSNDLQKILSDTDDLYKHSYFTFIHSLIFVSESTKNRAGNMRST